MLLSLGPADAARATEQSGTTAQSSPQGPNNVNVVNVPTVTVGNTSLQPVPVKEQVNEPVHLNFALAIAEGFGSALATYDIPAGKQFVVEHFAAHCLSSSQPMEVIAFLSSQQADLTFLSTKSVTFAFGQNLNTGAAPVKAYVSQGNVRVQVGRNSASGRTDCTATVLGHLAPLS
jgi:hypothetical protein